jgi:peptidoglycan/xylan/chitin deacetylase (PgdA/CDA1 family)
MSVVRGIARRLTGGRPAEAAIGVLERLAPRRPDTLAILTFHRITGDAGAVPPGLLSTTPEGFGSLLDALARGHHIVDLAAVLRRRRGGAALPARSLLLTFDDAYVDMRDHVRPALIARGLPAVLFVPTAYPGAAERRFWWDALHHAVRASERPAVDGPHGVLPLAGAAARARAYRVLRDHLKTLPHEALTPALDRLVGALGVASAPPRTVLDWQGLRDLQGTGIELAPHTRTHPLLPRLPPERLSDEIAGSRTDLEREWGAGHPVFAYPSGATSPQVVKAVHAASLEVAMTTQRGVNDLRTAQWLSLRRVNVSIRTPPAAIRAQLLA